MRLATRIVISAVMGAIWGVFAVSVSREAVSGGGVRGTTVVSASAVGWTLGALLAEPFLPMEGSNSREKIVTGVCAAACTSTAVAWVGGPSSMVVFTGTGCLGFSAIEVFRVLWRRRRGGLQ